MTALMALLLAVAQQPATPGNPQLVVVLPAADAIVLAWEQPELIECPEPSPFYWYREKGVSGFVVFVGRKPGLYTKGPDTGVFSAGMHCTFLDGKVSFTYRYAAGVPGLSYYLAVAAVGTDGRASLKSAEISGVFPGVPSALSATKVAPRVEVPDVDRPNPIARAFRKLFGGGVELLDEPEDVGLAHIISAPVEGDWLEFYDGYGILFDAGARSDGPICVEWGMQLERRCVTLAELRRLLWR